MSDPKKTGPKPAGQSITPASNASRPSEASGPSRRNRRLRVNHVRVGGTREAVASNSHTSQRMSQHPTSKLDSSHRRLAASLAASLMVHGTLVAGLVGAPIASYLAGQNGLSSEINELSGSIQNVSPDSTPAAQTVELVETGPVAELAQVEPLTSESVAPAMSKTAATSAASTVQVVVDTPKPKPVSESKAEVKVAKVLPAKAVKSASAQVARNASQSSASQTETPMLGTESLSDPNLQTGSESSGPASEVAVIDEPIEVNDEGEPIANDGPNSNPTSAERANGKESGKPSYSSRIQSQMQASANLETDPIEPATKEAESVAAAMAAAQAKKEDSNSDGSLGERQENGSAKGLEVASNEIRDVRSLKAMPGNPIPKYPSRDRLMRKEGTSVILGRISPDGKVTDVVLEQSSGSQQMDQAALEAFKKWKFQAGQEGWVRNPFQFRLVGQAQEMPASLRKQAILDSSKAGQQSASGGKESL